MEPLLGHACQYHLFDVQAKKQQGISHKKTYILKCLFFVLCNIKIPPMDFFRLQILKICRISIGSK